MSMEPLERFGILTRCSAPAFDFCIPHKAAFWALVDCMCDTSPCRSRPDQHCLSTPSLSTLHRLIPSRQVRCIRTLGRLRSRNGCLTDTGQTAINRSQTSWHCPLDCRFLLKRISPVPILLFGPTRQPPLFVSGLINQSHKFGATARPALVLA